MKIQEINLISKLFDIYSKLLTEKQQEVVTQYIFNNLSLAEISELLNITRQAVKDLLDRSIALLKGYEEKLQILYKYNLTSELLRDSNLTEEQNKQFVKIWEE